MENAGFALHQRFCDIGKNVSMDYTQAAIPEQLIYEMTDGVPVYYRGYQGYLHGEKEIAQIMGSSKIQAYLIAELVFLLRGFLGKEYHVFTNEIGILLKEKTWRAADIAVIHQDQVTDLDSTYLDVPPQLVIEIDTKADWSGIEDPLSYYQKKTDELLDFGVEKVIWIFSETKKVMLAEQHRPWITVSWEEEIDLLPGLPCTIRSLL